MSLVVQNTEKRILIVDDEAALRTVFSMALKSERIKTREAADGHEALKFLKDEDFDLVLLDLRMPGPSGLDVLKRMRQRGDYTPVVIVSAYAPGSAIIRGISLGVTSFIGKPITLTQIRQVVDDQLERKENSAIDRAKKRVEWLDFSGAAAELRGLEDFTLLREILHELAKGKSPKELSHLNDKSESLIVTQPKRRGADTEY